MPPCTCGGRGHCFVCESAEAVRFAELKRSAGESSGASDFYPNSLVDRPFRTSTSPSSLPVIRKMGSLLGIPALRDAKPDDTSNPIITRATNLAGMLTGSMLKLPAGRREAALEEIGGMAWAQEVLRTAATMHGKLSATDAIHFSLTLMFIVGAVDAQHGKFTPAANAYTRAFKMMDKAQDTGRAQSLGIIRRGQPARRYAGFGRDPISGPVPTGTTAPIGTAPAPIPGTSLYVPVVGTLAPTAREPIHSMSAAAGTNLLDPTAKNWFITSPNGRVVLAVTSNGLVLYYKKGGSPVTDANAVTPAGNQAAFSSADYVPLKGWGLPSNVASLRGMALTQDGYPSFIYKGTDGSWINWPFLVGRTPNGMRVAVGAQALEAARMDYAQAQAAVQLVKPVADAHLDVQDDGNVVVYGPDGTVLQTLDTYRDLASIFPAPPEIPAVDYAQFNTENCNWGALLDAKRLWKKDGIRIAFARVFGRAPNNAEITYYGAMRWCIDADGFLGGKKSTLEEAMETVRSQLFAGKAANTTPPPSQQDMVAPPSSNPVTEFLSQAANWSTDILCKGFHALLDNLPAIGTFGSAVADILCVLVQTFTNAVGNTLASAVEIILAVAKALIALITGLGAGKPVEAITGFFRELTVAIFFAVFGLGSGVVAAGATTGPFLTFLIVAGADQTSIKVAQERVRQMAYAAADDDPLYPLTLAISVVTVVFAPTPQTALQLAVVLVPVVSALAAPTLQALPILANQTVTAVRKGLASFLRLAITVAMGITALSDLVATVQKQLTEKASKDGPLQTILCNMAGNIPQEPNDPTPPREKTVAWCIGMIIKRLARALDPKNPQSIVAAIAKIQLGSKTDNVVDNINKAAVGILTLLPALLLVFAGGAIESDPSLQANINQWFITANAAPGMLTNKDASEVTTAMKNLLSSLNSLQKTDAVAEQQRMLDLESSATLTAKTLWERVGKDGISAADRIAYFTAMRKTWTAQGGVV